MRGPKTKREIEMERNQLWRDYKSAIDRLKVHYIVHGDTGSDDKATFLFRSIIDFNLER